MTLNLKATKSMLKRSKKLCSDFVEGKTCPSTKSTGNGPIITLS